MNRVIERAIRPLRSRKVRVALATVIAAMLAEYGFDVPAEIVATILSVGVAVILGIAVEDHGLKSRAVTMIYPKGSGRDGDGKRGSEK